MNRNLARHGLRWTKRLLTAGFDLVFPPRCAGCSREGSVWCTNCDQNTHRLAGLLCARCGYTLPSWDTCPWCRQRELPLVARSYAFYDGPLIHALLHLKYRPDRRLAARMANWLADVFRREAWGTAMIVPVPLGRDRLKQRGYNQADMIASALARILQQPYSKTALWRTRETKSQVGLDIAARIDNVHRAFMADSREVQSREVLLVDDLFTTGATLSACALALLDAGASEVRGITVARAVSGFLSSPIY